MSRWVDGFTNHAFRSTWDELRKALSAEKVNNLTIIDSVKELSRLKKVVSYLNGLIQTLDPELLPATFWDNCDSQAAPCFRRLKSYKSDKNIAHLHEANAHADNLLTYILPYVIAPKSMGNVLQEAIKSYAQSMEEYSNSFREKAATIIEQMETYEAEVKKSHDGIEKTKMSAAEFEVELFGSSESEGFRGRISKLAEEFETRNNSIVDFYNETFLGDEEHLSTKKEITQAKEATRADQKEIEGLLISVTKKVTDLEEFHIKIFGRRVDDDELPDGFSAELDECMERLREYESKQKTKYKALNDQIESLLPGATSAGLATAYKDMKTSFDEPINKASKMFGLSIALLVVVSFLSAIESVGIFYVNFVRFDEWNMVLKGLIHKIPFYGPILWLAFYYSKRRSEYQRLQQEYAHKEALAKSYDSYKKQIEELDKEDKEMQKTFIMKTIEAIAYNASSTLDGKHGDKMPSHTLLESLLHKKNAL